MKKRLSPRFLKNRLRAFLTSLSLIILALGFSVLGFVPLIYKTCSAVRNCSAENAGTLIGSGSSILVGATFLVAAYSFRRVRSGSRRLIEPIDADLI